jgi:hypothetical protein
MSTAQYTRIQCCDVQMETTQSRYSFSLNQSKINRDDGSENTKKNPQLTF